MGRPAYLILHGYQGSGPGHWQAWLAGRLQATDAVVRFPDLPDADAPRLDAWLQTVDRELTDDSIVVCHSLACLLWLHHVARGGAGAQRVLLVAPPSRAGAPEVLHSFFPVEPVELSNARLVCSDNDPYCPEGAADVYPGLPTDLLPGAGHINPDAGYGPWPAVEAWARSGTTPLAPR
jgi:predicted alpha/beta hydrolase family esterase